MGKVYPLPEILILMVPTTPLAVKETDEPNSGYWRLGLPSRKQMSLMKTNISRTKRKTRIMTIRAALRVAG
jgi:hypothetical protein